MDAWSRKNISFLDDQLTISIRRVRIKACLVAQPSSLMHLLPFYTERGHSWQVLENYEDGKERCLGLLLQFLSYPSFSSPSSLFPSSTLHISITSTFGLTLACALQVLLALVHQHSLASGNIYSLPSSHYLSVPRFSSTESPCISLISPSLQQSAGSPSWSGLHPRWFPTIPWTRSTMSGSPCPLFFPTAL